MGAPFYIATGDTVKIDGWGLSGSLLRVGEHVGEGHFRLERVSNGNALPGAWSERMMERVA